MSAPIFCERLLRETRVLLFPGTLFGDTDDRYVRMSLLQPLARMQEAMRRITAARDLLFLSAPAEQARWTASLLLIGLGTRGKMWARVIAVCQV